jgi:hypothetical protein
MISLSWNSTSLYVTTSSSGRFDFLIVWSTFNIAFTLTSSETCSVSNFFLVRLPELARFTLADPAFLAVFSLTEEEEVFDARFSFEECFTTKNTAKDSRYIIKRYEFSNNSQINVFILYISSFLPRIPDQS